MAICYTSISKQKKMAGDQTYTIVNGRQDFIVEVASSVRVSNGNRQSKALDEVPRVGNIDDQQLSTLVSNGAVRIGCSVVVKVAAEGGSRVGSARITISSGAGSHT